MLLQLHLFLFTGRLIVYSPLQVVFLDQQLLLWQAAGFFLRALSVSFSFCSQVTSSCPKLAHAHKLQLQQPVYRTWMLRPNTGPYPRAVNRTWANVLFTACENGLYTGRGWATSCIQAVHGPVTARFQLTAWNGPVDFWLCSTCLQSCSPLDLGLWWLR